MITIRNAERKDMASVHGLICELAHYEKQPEAVITTAADLERHGFDEHRFECLVAENDSDGIVGMALFYPRYSTWKGPTLHLEDFYVRPAYRTQGVGKALFDRVVYLAAERKVGRMEWTVLEWNTIALDFYKKYGADLDSEWHLGTLNQQQLAAFLK